MKYSWFNRFKYGFTISGFLVILFQNCGPAHLNSEGEIQTSSTSPSSYSDPTNPSSSAPSTVAPTVTTVCAPFPSSNLVVNVKTAGAVGNASADDTAAIQSAISQVAGTGGTVLVPAGIYMINALAGLNLGNNMTLKLDPGAELKAITNGSSTYTVVTIKDKSNVNIVGGTISGERTTHTGTAGQRGTGIIVSGGTNVVVEGTTIRDAWGDGLYIDYGTIAAASTNVKLCSIKAVNNRRQGLAIIAARDLLVQDSFFEGSNGTLPAAGINIDASRPVSNITIRNTQFTNNQGFAITAYEGSASTISNLKIEANNFSGNGGAIQLPFITNSSITGNNIADDRKLGIRLYLGALGNTVSDNDITVTGAAVGSALLIDPGNTVFNNTLH